jgi:small subunit ribosomal protein S3
MGQKVHPIGFRLGITKGWKAKWYAEKGYGDLLEEDLKIRRYIKEKLYHAGISTIVIERVAATKAGRVKIDIWTARPGLVIGKKGAEVENLKRELENMTQKEVILNIKEIKRPELDAQLVAENIAFQIERRVSHRRAMKRAISMAMKLGAQGVKVSCKGRLGGAELARAEWYREGRLPLQTLRADIDYGFAVAKTKYGTIGVKVWIYKGEVLEKEDLSDVTA